jgi:uncharacterized protein (DUF2062 family)
MHQTLKAARQNVAHWLSRGITPRRLAVTLALGFALGCFPILGVPTLLCAALAVMLRLNLPAIQAANYAAMPLQLALIVPFVRLGRWLLPAHFAHLTAPAALHGLPAFNLAARIGSMAGEALLAWLLVAIPAVILIAVLLTPVLRRIPVLNTAGSGD